MAGPEILSSLEASPLLRRCGIDCAAVSVRHYRGGQIINDRPGGLTSVGLVADGAVDVYSVAADGRDVQLNTLRRGDCFGIANLLAPAEMETVLHCSADTTIIYIPKRILISLMERDAAFSLRYAAYCNQKIQFLLRRIEMLTIQSCRGKVIGYLLSRQDSIGSIRTDCSREDWARRLGISRAALFRELAYLQSQGLLVLQNGDVLIVDQAGLEQILYQLPAPNKTPQERSTYEKAVVYSA